MTDIEMLPLPEADGFMETFDTYGYPVGSEDAWGEETVKETIRANVAHATAAKDAEIERLRAERDTVVNEAAKYAERSGRAQAEVDRLRRDNERLVEVLREAQPFIGWIGSYDELHAKIDALIDHDQEGDDA